VTLDAIINQLVTDTLDSIALFRPELVLCATMVVLLLGKILPLINRVDPFYWALIGTVVALVAAVPDGGLSQLGSVEHTEIFTGMLVYDTLTVSLRLILLVFAVLLIILSKLTGLADRDDGQDFFTLVLGATLGMCLMASANHLMAVFLAVEMASVPSYVLAGIVKGRRRAGEAALKYAVFGAGAAGVMLYGISLLIGVLGTAHLPTVANRLAELDIPQMLASGGQMGTLMVLSLAALMIMVGLAFKLSAVPFHFWCPDVFEGATAEVDAFLSVASKAAALALLVRVAVGVSAPSVENEVTAKSPTPVQVRGDSDTYFLSTTDGRVFTGMIADLDAQIIKLRTAEGELFSIPRDETDEMRVVSNTATSVAAEGDAQQESPLSPVRTFVATLLGVVAAVTCTFGNLAAYGQTNIKRMLAYSTIAHAGYMIMPVAAAVLLMGTNRAAAGEAIAALLIYAAIYLFMNLGAFAIVAFLRNTMQSETIDDYAGLIRTAPITAVSMTLILVSLIGLPPLAGFIGKFAIFLTLVDAGGALMITLLVIAGINTAISLVYYLRVAKRMCIDPEPDSRGPVSLGIFPSAYVFAITVPVVLLGVYPTWLTTIAQSAGEQLFR
jgi:NADH-quinone oxidoreductase subunit N